MSDGPHRSLPMSQGWRRFAERIYIEAFSHDEERNALVTALEQDWRKGNIEGAINELETAAPARRLLGYYSVG